MTIKAVLFDLDETLFNRTASLRLFLSDQASRFSTLQLFESDTFYNQFLLLDQRGRVSKDAVYSELLSTQSKTDDESAATLFRDYEDNFWRFATAFSGLEEMFASLHAQAAKTGIVTNGQTHIQLRSLLALNLDREVSTYLISESEGARKPDREIFERAAQRLGVKSSECMFVGDTPVTDVLGAQRCGMKGVWFPNGATWPNNIKDRPDASITSLKDVPELFRKWS